MFWNHLLSGVFLSLIILLSLGSKWDIERKISLPVAFIIGILSGVITNAIISFWSLGFFLISVLQIIIIIFIAGSLLLWRFYRDPERIPPEGENSILSPADGRIIYIKKTDDGNIPYSEKKGRRFSLNDFVQSDVFSSKGYLIGISMNFLDVHINRAPINGNIDLLKHIKGLFMSLRKKEAILTNERVLTVIDNGHFKVGIVQIASRLVRKIVPFINEGSEVHRGERIGMIRFGSQVDLYIPDIPSLCLDITEGQKVVAGLTVIANYK
jgi:phosphatidylserine decarboxylase